MAVELAAMGFYLPISVDTESLKPNFGGANTAGKIVLKLQMNA